MRRSRRVRRRLLAVLAAVAWVPGVGAQDGPAFRLGFGSSSLGGDIGEHFDGAVDAEFSVLVPVWRLRLGGGANWASHTVSGSESSFSRIRFHALVGAPFRSGERLRPYVEARYTFQRFRPEDDRYFGGEDRVLREFVSSGSGVDAVMGVEVGLTPRVAVDLSGGFGTFTLSPDLGDEGLAAVDSGRAWRIQVGVTWFPVHGHGRSG